MNFELVSPYKPTGDQPKAIEALLNDFKRKQYNTLLGVTGSGKTFVTANIIASLNKPTLIIAHNKTLAAQLYQEYRDFFPNNAVEFFVSYYDYYQPESYIPSTDTYIEKDADINEEIDRLRLSATASLLSRKDVIVISSVSCIYNLGSPVEYAKQMIRLKSGMKIKFNDLLFRLSELQYNRNDLDFQRGSYRLKGDTIDIYPANQSFAIRIELLEDIIGNIKYFDPITGEYLTDKNKYRENLTKAQEDFVKSHDTQASETIILPAKHYVASKDNQSKAIQNIRDDLQKQIKYFEDNNEPLKAHRIKQKTLYDLEMIEEVGYCKGIENYSRYFDGREQGASPYSLLDYFMTDDQNDYLLVIDESHITVPQINGMYKGDLSRKQTLIDYGFRLPSALDNRPLRFDEFQRRMGHTLFTSATPKEWELNLSGTPVELIVRPTGLIDPEIEILPTEGQILNLEGQIKTRVAQKQRVLVTTLTKRMAEEISNYLNDKGYKVAYLHSDIETLERSDILDNLRKGTYDVLVGINLLREGLDLPEVSLVAILDADKEGFLRSDAALIQTMGRAARHVNGKVIMYADKITDSMKRAIDEVERRRNIQIEYNKINNITPITITKPIREKILIKVEEQENPDDNLLNYEYKILSPKKQKDIIKELEKKMKTAAGLLEFETAAKIRDRIKELKSS